MMGVIQDGTDNSYLDYYSSLIGWATPAGNSHIYREKKCFRLAKPISFHLGPGKTDNSQILFLVDMLVGQLPSTPKKRNIKTEISLPTSM
jgi:hypothetical protein